MPAPQDAADLEPLFSMPAGAVRAAPRRHVLLPDMGFACGRTMLDDDARQDPWVTSARDWCWVTCPDCLQLGRREVRRVTHRMQKPERHDCTPAACEWMSEPA